MNLQTTLIHNGDEIIVRPNYGRDEPIKVKVDTLLISLNDRDGDGFEVNSVSWQNVKDDTVLFGYLNPQGTPKWAYSNQVSPVGGW